jgi:peptidoglycan hydrolase-like protein with peptidoglycan-binding domain
MRVQRSRQQRRRHTSVVAAGAVVLVAAGAGVAYLELPRTQLSASERGLARIDHHGVAERLLAVHVSIAGHRVPVRVVDNRILPRVPIAQGSVIDVEATLRTPPWLRWLLGPTTTTRTSLVAPTTRLLDPVVITSKGSVTSYFSTPVSVVRITTPAGEQTIRLARPARKLTLISPSSQLSAGVVDVAAAPAPWEEPATPSSLTFFRTSTTSPIAIVSPGTTGLTPTSSVTVTLSQPVAKVFGNANPTIEPTVQGADPVEGTWSRPTPFSLVFTPTTPDFWPGESFTLHLPTPVQVAGANGSLGPTTNSLTLTGATPSILRLQELLAQLGYLPLRFTPSSPVPPSLDAQAAATINPPSGTFSWSWSMPSPLESLWQQGAYTVITQGAVMAFEHAQGLDDNGLANPLLWPTLIHDALTHTLDPHPYSYILVSKARPETLWLYVNGQVVLTSPVNTGIPGLNTPVGTWPIYLRYVENYMSGTNPNGTPYHDLVHWINYFNGSVAVHGFPRAAYGFPQSLGCVELPVATAGVLYPQVHIGTLVTVLPS